MKKYFDNRRSISLGGMANVLNVLTVLLLIAAVIAFFCGIAEEAGFVLCILFVVSALLLWITNAFLKGFVQLVETAELQKADILKRYEETNSQNKETENSSEEKISDKQQKETINQHLQGGATL
jgi:high-affinity K+ transport system ATPase subunit B